MPDGATRIAIPRWIQLVGLPLLLLLVWSLASTFGRAVFLFIVAALIALLLNPIVRALGRIKIPRGIAIAIVYLSFAAAATFCVIALATVGADRVRSTANRVNDYFTTSNRHHQTGAEHDVDRLQIWLDTHHLERVKIRKQGIEFVRGIDVKGVTSQAISLIEGAALSAIEILFSIVLVVVVSIYMLLDMSRLSAAIDRRFPPRNGSPPLLTQLEQALAGYVKGQLLLSLIIGFSAGAGLWLLGATGLLPGADRYALYFGLWVAFTELIPYLGPWLGAIPPLLYALVLHPFSALWVALLFLGIHQIEGHIVVPKVMGSALRLHPLARHLRTAGRGGDVRSSRRLRRPAAACGSARALGVLRRASDVRDVDSRLPRRRSTPQPRRHRPHRRRRSRRGQSGRSDIAGRRDEEEQSEPRQARRAAG